jgi:ketosteroid isomerase-like protein
MCGDGWALVGKVCSEGEAMRKMWFVVLCLSASGMTALAQKPDITAAQAEIMKADEDFNQSVVDRNQERFLSLIADGATFGGGTPNEQRGKDSISKAWSVFFDPKGPTLTWHPSKAEVLAGGDVGYTTGFSERRAPNGAVNKGNYLTVWKKQQNGSWKVIYDTGTGVPAS